MTDFHSSSDVLDVLNELNESDLDWILLRNTEDEIPSHLVVGKDIDILVKSTDSASMHSYLAHSGYRPIPHPLRHDVRLYGVDEFKMYTAQNGVLLDINFQLVVKSFDKGQWIPLHSDIQESIWKNSVSAKIGTADILQLGNEDLFLATLARCVFDKKQFSDWHKNMLYNVLLNCNEKVLMQKLELVFYRFSTHVVSLVKSRKFDFIISDYFRFADY